MTDIIIIGAGAAGMTAALYALRSGKSVLLLEKENCGGQIANSPRVENFPSIKTISGGDFADNLFEQITDLGAKFELENVLKVEKNGDTFCVTTDYGAHKSKAVIIAGGAKHRRTGVAGEEELIGRGVSYCALCDGAFYKGGEVALIGDANSALQYTVQLAGYCRKVTVLTLFDKFFAEDFLIKKVRALPNVEVFHELALQEFKSNEEGLTGLVFKRKDGSVFEFPTKAVFIAIGQVPDNKVFESLARLDENGYLKADETCQTKTAGLFAAGDCRSKKVRQLTTAVADGAVAGTTACAFIDSLK